LEKGVDAMTEALVVMAVALTQAVSVIAMLVGRQRD
jgi:hypothetical protein